MGTPFQDSPRLPLQQLFYTPSSNVPVPTHGPPVQFIIPEYYRQDIAHPKKTNLLIKNVTFFDKDTHQETTEDITLSEVKEHFGDGHLVDVAIVIQDVLSRAGTDIQGEVSVDKTNFQFSQYVVKTVKGPALRTQVYLSEFYEANNHTELGVDLNINLRIKRQSNVNDDGSRYVSVEKYYVICRANPDFLGEILGQSQLALELVPRRVQRIYLDR